MPSESEIQKWRDKIRTRYENYLKTSFYFKDTALRESFAQALRKYELMRKEIPEPARSFQRGAKAQNLAKKYFGDKANHLLPALREGNLYSHQEEAIRLVYGDKKNVVVATGTASGKTESFLYPILFELYRQHLAKELQAGVRALILYPMNALANDQRQRLGEEICEKLRNEDSDFQPTFGQYIGETPEDKNSRYKDFKRREEERLPGELIFRKEMRETPPHILLTNYSMLEYLLIRPDDSPLFDKDMGRHWQFIVLDEAHQYRGVKGMEMGMLIRRLKQRLRAGGRGDQSFRCIATSATISSDKSEEGKSAVAQFAGELFGEKDGFSAENIVFGKREESENSNRPSRFHLFMRALEGAFLVRENGADKVVLNRIGSENSARPLEIALCGECGQHYYVGQVGGESVAKEAVRDPSHENFGVDFYLPLPEEQSTGANLRLCRHCGKIGKHSPDCGCDEADSAADLVPVKKCESHKDHKDQLKKCEACGYSRGSFGDPVQEIVHGTDGPNVVIATALHGLLSEKNRKILAFADNRQEAAFFAWYAQDSYEKFRDRNLIWRALTHGNGEVSLDGLANSLRKICDENQVFPENRDSKDREREMRAMIYREAVTDQRRISLEGVGLAKWFLKLPKGLPLPQEMLKPPWNFTESESRLLIALLLDDLRIRRAVRFPGDPYWKTKKEEKVSDYPQLSVCINEPKGRKKTFGWSNPQRPIVGHFLVRLLPDNGLKMSEKKERAQDLMRAIWKQIRQYDKSTEDADKLFLRLRAGSSGGFHLNLAWLRVKAAQESDDLWQCDTCERLHFHNIRNVCQRNKCPGNLIAVKAGDLAPNHYRKFYEDKEMPIRLEAEEHTAQISSGEAQERQKRFRDKKEDKIPKENKIHLLSSSTTFELGVDLGDLEVVFLRNVPPEPFNYAQRAGRAGRRDDMPGLVITYCRRNPHDLYHYADPEKRILKGEIRTPPLRLRNEKIISRHIAATALSAFFRENAERFRNVECLIGGDWGNPQGGKDFKRFCEQKRNSLETALRSIVPEEMHEETGLASDGSWIEKVAGKASRFAEVEMKVCKDYNNMERLRTEFFKQRRRGGDRIIKRMDTIAYESTLRFLSRQAVIPKYGFPVDVVELDTHPSSNSEAAKVSLQRDLSQAIAEYAPGCKVVADKKEWESYGVKTFSGKELQVKFYDDEQHIFKQWEGDPATLSGARKYLRPQFGFVTDFFKKPKEPQRRTQRLYTTRPYFAEAPDADTREFLGVKITQAVPGKLVVLCEGKNGRGFHICLKCGVGFADRKNSHKSPNGDECKEMLYNLSLGHEFVTDVTRLDFPYLRDKEKAYSLAYAVLLGAASALEVPDTDLNSTITGSLRASGLSIVLYDNVPGGAGLVANLYEKEETFRAVLKEAKERVKGECGCDSSCYGCLRSYRNQFAHPYLQRNFALQCLEKALEGRD